MGKWKQEKCNGRGCKTETAQIEEFQIGESPNVRPAKGLAQPNGDPSTPRTRPGTLDETSRTLTVDDRVGVCDTTTRDVRNCLCNHLPNSLSN